MEPVNDIAAEIGKIMTNLLSVELALRLFLYEIAGPKDPTFDIDRIAVDVPVKETPLTSYDTLGDLIKKVNKQLACRGLDARIDESLVELRDALAHGRMLSSQRKGPFRLYKFDKPANGLVRLVRADELSPEWLAAQIRRTYSEACKIVSLARSLGLTCFPVEPPIHDLGVKFGVASERSLPSP